ncbi:MAG TPA: GNAT family N-acetyltransferase [Pedobacter sp.]|uniref:GNAT family N-acetyltransferase n=1 Tax=Pedobacter sp. TaxID=1411316 RepID=UPI002B56D9D0|nr:GNAT family N-acetyltransferase [Pedobacter sp.]HMI01909.1 GNAT family N-acetyltransferase [Pedobacter sp.]
MNIRKAEVKDAEVIERLLEQLGYPTENGLVARRLSLLANNDEHLDAVVEMENEVFGFMSLHFIPQIAFDAEYAVISYLVVDDKARSLGIGKILEEYAVEIAAKRGCKRIFLHSNARRTDAHRFYLRQGYQEYAKAFVKYLG